MPTHENKVPGWILSSGARAVWECKLHGGNQSGDTRHSRGLWLQQQNCKKAKEKRCKYIFMPSGWQHLRTRGLLQNRHKRKHPLNSRMNWTEVVKRQGHCDLTPVPFSLVQYLWNVWRKFQYIWRKPPLGLTEGLISLKRNACKLQLGW